MKRKNFLIELNISGNEMFIGKKIIKFVPLFKRRIPQKKARNTPVVNLSVVVAGLVAKAKQPNILRF